MLLSGSVQFDHVLFGTPTAAPIVAITPATGSTSPYGYSPAEIRSAYGVNSIQLGSVVGTGSGQTIAIVDAYDDPALVSSTASNFLASDLHEFDLEFGLADPFSFRKLDQYGGTDYPGTDPAGPGNSWAVEESLDVEWAHVIAPGANIVLVEANSSSTDDLACAIATAAHLPGVSVVSMSFGCPESSTELQQDALYTTPAGHAGVTYVASAGDSGAPGGYPAFSPNVVAVGGTILSAPGGVYGSETAWSLSDGWGTGGGQSSYEPEPSYQTGVQQSGWREMPDVAFDAATAVPVYDSYDFGQSTPWEGVGGTSLSAPCWAGLIATADQLRATQGLASLDGPTQTLPALYGLPAADFHDITSGNNGYPAGPGYDMCTGLGTPVASSLVPALAAWSASTELVTATSSNNQPYYGQSVTFTASVLAPPGTGTPTGTVTFRDGSLILGTAPLGSNEQASFSTSALTTGVHTITDWFGGDSQLPANATLVTETVSPDSTTTVVEASASTLRFGQSVTLTATVTAAPSSLGTPTGTVTFMVGTTVLGTAPLSGGVAQCVTQALPAGMDAVTAVYSGGVNFSGSTSALVGPASIISTVAGNGSSVWGDSGDGGPATAARLWDPSSVAVDAAGDIFIAESISNRIREVNHATGLITTIAGNGTCGYSGDGGPATSAELGYPIEIISDAAGDIFFSDWDYDVVREINHATGIITTVAGNGTWGYSGDGGPAIDAELYLPGQVAVDAAGDVFIPDYYNSRVREVNHATGVITTVAGNGGFGFGGDGGPATAAELDAPEALGFDAAGNLYILEAYTGVDVRKVDLTTGIITTVAGDAAPGWNSTGDGGPATAAQLGAATGIAVDASGDLFIAEWSATNNNGGVIREVNHATGVITTVAGDGATGFTGNGGPAASAFLGDPYGVTVDANGNLFIADSDSNLIRQVAHNTLSVTVSQAVPTLSVNDPGGTFDGSLFAATALVSGVVSGVDTTPARSLEGVSPTLTYYAGGSASGTGSATAPTSAGTYTVVATYPGSTDYAAAQSSPLTFTINKATPTLILSDAGGTFNGLAFAGTSLVSGINAVAASMLEGVRPSCTYYAGSTASGSGSATAPTSVGTYTVVATFPGSADYTAAQSSPLTFIINQAMPTLTLSDAGGTFNGLAFAGTSLVSGTNAVAASMLEGVSPSFIYYEGSSASGTGSTTAPTSAGTYTVVATFPGSADYTAVQNGPLTFTINKATPTLTPSDGGGTFNGSAFAATALVSGVVNGVDTTPAGNLEGVPPTLTYYAGSTVSGIGSATAPTSAGNYTVVATFPGSADYTSAQSSPVTFTINQAMPTLTLSDAGGTFNGSAFEAASLVSGVVSGVDTTPAGSLEGVSPSFTYYAGGTTSGTGSATAPTSAGTYTVMAVFPGSTDYTSSSRLTSFSVNRATPNITWAGPFDITYGTALGTSQLDATSSVPGTFTYGPFAGWLLSTGLGQLLTAVFVPVDATDYTQATATVQINVAPAPLTITVLPAGKFAGQPNPAFSSSYTGFVLGQGPAVLSGSIAFSTAANTVSASGFLPDHSGRTLVAELCDHVCRWNLGDRSRARDCHQRAVANDEAQQAQDRQSPRGVLQRGS